MAFEQEGSSWRNNSCDMGIQFKYWSIQEPKNDQQVVKKGNPNS